jgi:chemotaxis protein MotB
MATRHYADHGADEESYFASMTDVFIGLLFIFIIMLMFFAMRFQEVSCTRFRRHRVRCFMEQEVRHGEKAVYAGVQA